MGGWWCREQGREGGAYHAGLRTTEGQPGTAGGVEPARRPAFRRGPLLPGLRPSPQGPSPSGPLSAQQPPLLGAWLPAAITDRSPVCPSIRPPVCLLRSGLAPAALCSQSSHR